MFARSWPKRSERGLCPRNPGGGIGGGQNPPFDYVMGVRLVIPRGILAQLAD